MVGIAQLVERLVVVQEAAGSSPVTHPKCLAGRNGQVRVPSTAVKRQEPLFL